MRQGSRGDWEWRSRTWRLVTRRKSRRIAPNVGVARRSLAPGASRRVLSSTRGATGWSTTPIPHVCLVGSVLVLKRHAEALHDLSAEEMAETGRPDPALVPCLARGHSLPAGMSRSTLRPHTSRTSTSIPFPAPPICQITCAARASSACSRRSAVPPEVVRALSEELRARFPRT